MERKGGDYKKRETAEGVCGCVWSADVGSADVACGIPLGGGGGETSVWVSFCGWGWGD